MAQKIVLPGGSGFLGTALARHFSPLGWEVVILSRRAAPAQGSIRTVVWDGRTQGPWSAELDGADAVINLAGRSIGCLHTPKNRREILESRVDSVRAIETAVAGCPRPPSVLVQASAIGFYGDRSDEICNETTPAGNDFLASVVSAWEAAFLSAAPGGPRRVVLRQGHLLSPEGGFLAPLARLTRCFLGGAAGDGRQYISWLHLADFCALCEWMIAQPECQGIYNACSSAPVTNAEFMRQLRQALDRPWCPPAPRAVVQVMARYVLRVDPSLALTGCRCAPWGLEAEGFTFRHPELREALRDLLSSG